MKEQRSIFILINLDSMKNTLGVFALNHGSIGQFGICGVTTAIGYRRSYRNVQYGYVIINTDIVL